MDTATYWYNSCYLTFSRVLVTHVLYWKLPSTRILDCLEPFLSVTSKRLSPPNRQEVVETKPCRSRFGLRWEVSDKSAGSGCGCSWQAVVVGHSGAGGWDRGRPLHTDMSEVLGLQCSPLWTFFWVLNIIVDSICTLWRFFLTVKRWQTYKHLQGL